MKLKAGVSETCNANLLAYGIIRKLADLLTSQDLVGDFVAVAERWYAVSKPLPSEGRDGVEKLLRWLGTQGASVKDLVYYMHKINFGDGLALFVEPESPNIVSQPDLPGQRITVTEGRPLTLCCSASGIPSPSYQWYNGSRCLDGQNKSKLFVEHIRSSDNGIYFCVARNECGDVRSAPVTVTVQAPHSAINFVPDSPTVRRTATNKIALLIGNCNYRCDKSLRAPARDILFIGKKLADMKFKVITCKNLRKSDMLCIIDFFVELLTEGVYGLLYFAGHGFENHGQCYLVPTDAPTDYSSDNCISADYVLFKMQNKLPALCLIMLDICREMKHSDDLPSSFIPPPKPTGNCVIAYATSFGTKAWEKPQMSIFAKHLLQYIDKPLPIVSLLQEVITSVGKDEQAKEIQFPEIRSNLRDYNRLLSDEICSTGYTSVVSRSAELWQKVAELPTARFYDKLLPDLGVKIVFHLEALHSNVLVVSIGCIKTENNDLNSCQAYISWVKPVTVQACAQPLRDSSKWPASMKQNPLCLSVTDNTIADLQLLDQDLVVHVTIEAHYDTPPNVRTKRLPCNFRRPLISQLQIASVIQNPSATENPFHEMQPSRRAPVECADIVPVESLED